jgi:hypothetical protein
LLIGDQPSVSGKVMLGPFYLDRIPWHRSERQFLQVLQDVLVQAGVHLLQAGRAQRLGAMIQLEKVFRVYCNVFDFLLCFGFYSYVLGVVGICLGVILYVPY